MRFWPIMPKIVCEQFLSLTLHIQYIIVCMRMYTGEGEDQSGDRGPVCRQTLVAFPGWSQGMSVREEAEQFGVLKLTLRDHISGRVQPGAAPGTPRYLDKEEEKEVVRWLEGCASIGFAKTVKEVRSIVGATVVSKNKLENIVVSYGWWDRFRARHPHLTLRTGESLAYHCATGTNPAIIDKYFDLLEVFSSNNLFSRPHLIFNAYETGLPLQHCPGKRVAVRGQRHVHVINSGNKAHTVLACTSASGTSCHPWWCFRGRL